MHFTLISGAALASCVIFLIIVIVQMFRDRASGLVWLLLTALLSATPGLYLAERNTQRKADEAEAIERQQELAKQEFQRKRDEIAKNRTGAVGTQHETVALRNYKTLSRVTIKAFKDDGIVFGTDGGLIHTNWADLPDEWVSKYRDPVTADAALAKGAELTEALAEIEKMGCDVQVSYVRELTDKEGSLPVRGSVVKVLYYSGNGTKDYAGPNIFLAGTSRDAFAQSPLLKVRIYPISERVLLYSVDKNGVLTPGERLRMYTGSVSQALQMAKEAGIKLPDLSKDKFPSSSR